MCFKRWHCGTTGRLLSGLAKMIPRLSATTHFHTLTHTSNSYSDNDTPVVVGVVVLVVVSVSVSVAVDVAFDAVVVVCR